MLKKSLLILTAIGIGCVGLAGLSAWAEEEGGKFEERRQEMIKDLEERIGHLQEQKTCISNAKSKEDMKACHKMMKEKRMEHKKGRKAKKRERMNERIKELEEKRDSDDGDEADE